MQSIRPLILAALMLASATSFAKSSTSPAGGDSSGPVLDVLNAGPLPAGLLPQAVPATSGGSATSAAIQAQTAVLAASTDKILSQSDKLNAATQLQLEALSERSLYIGLALFVFLLPIFGGLFYAVRSNRRALDALAAAQIKPVEEEKPSAQERMAVLPLEILVGTLRDDVSVLLERLDVHGHKGSDLYQTLSKMLPSLEREAGRTRVNAREILEKADQDLDGSGMKLQAKSPVMGLSKAADIHAYVVSKIAKLKSA